MKKFLLFTALLTSLLGFSAQPSHAFLIYAVVTGHGGNPDGRIYGIACLILLPFCVLDQDAKTGAGISGSALDLQASGIDDPAVIERLLADENSLIAGLEKREKATGKKESVCASPSTSREELRKDLAEIMGREPSEDYVKLFQFHSAGCSRR